MSSAVGGEGSPRLRAVAKTYVSLEYAFEFKSMEDAQRGAARLDTEGIKTKVRQGRFDGALSDTIWWVEFDDVRWVAPSDVSQPDLVAEAESRAIAVERQLADVGCVQSLWGVEVSGGPAVDA
jgi:hypothetical protein